MITGARVGRDLEGVGGRDALPAPLPLPDTALPGKPPPRPVPPVVPDPGDDAPIDGRGSEVDSRRKRGMLGWSALVVKVIGTVASFGVILLLVVPSVLPYDAFFVRTGSMSPTLPVGSLVVSHRVHASTLEVGDVISFVRPGVEGGMVTHRIVKIDKGPHGLIFRTQGDRNPEPDGWIVDGRGEGWKMVAHAPRLGYVVGTLRDALRHRAVVFGVIAFLGLLTLVDIWRRPTIPSRKR